MIAHAAPAVAVADADAHREFEVIFPALQARLRRRFRRYRPDHREEHLADATAMAWLMFLSATRRGKDFTVNTLANYAARAILAGRRVAGYTDLDAAVQVLPRARIGGHVSSDSRTTTTGFCRPLVTGLGDGLLWTSWPRSWISGPSCPPRRPGQADH